MDNAILIKKNLFKVKKIVLDKDYRYDGFKNGDSLIGIIVPYFNTRSKIFEESYFSILTIDGKQINLKCDNIEIENTRIMDNKVREYLDKAIDIAKETYKLQKEEAKFYEELKKKQEAMERKILKQNEAMDKTLNQIRKARGFLTISEVVNSLNKVLSKELEQDYQCDNVFKLNLNTSNKVNLTFKDTTRTYLNLHTNVNKNTRLEVIFKDTIITCFKIDTSVEVTKWCKAEDYDFIYEEYDRTYNIGELDDSEDFKKLKSKYFKKYNNTELSKAKAIEYFDAEIGDKDYLYIFHTLRSDLNIECKKENLKEITNRLNSLLKLL